MTVTAINLNNLSTTATTDRTLELEIPTRCEECQSEVEIIRTEYPPEFRCDTCHETTRVYPAGWVTIPDLDPKDESGCHQSQ